MRLGRVGSRTCRVWLPRVCRCRKGRRVGAGELLSLLHPSPSTRHQRLTAALAHHGSSVCLTLPLPSSQQSLPFPRARANVLPSLLPRLPPRVRSPAHRARSKKQMLANPKHYPQFAQTSPISKAATDQEAEASRPAAVDPASVHRSKPVTIELSSSDDDSDEDEVREIQRPSK